MAELTPEERQRIYEEEKTRIEAREQIASEKQAQEAARLAEEEHARHVAEFAAYQRRNVPMLVLFVGLLIIVAVSFFSAKKQRETSNDASAFSGKYVSPPVPTPVVKHDAHNSKNTTVKVKSHPDRSTPVPAVPTPQTADTTTIEYQLATIYKGHSPSDGDPVVEEFASVLDALERKCKPTTGNITTRHGISNVILKAQEILDNRGVQENVLELAHHLDDSIPSDFHHTIGIDEVAAAYIALRAPRQ